MNPSAEIAATNGRNPHGLPVDLVRENAEAAVQRDWLWLVILWAIVTAYNLFKPYHIDDTAHLEIARWIGAHPFQPMSGQLNWDGLDEPIYKTNQPHLYFYLLALWGGMFGYSEPAMHALQSLAALACVLLFHRLARVFVGPAALWATAMLVLGPAFIVEQNLMVDVPLLAAWLAFFNLLICNADSPRQDRRYGLAALACAAALLIKYSSVVLVVVLCLSLLLERRKAQVWTVLIPLTALAAWSLFNVLEYGGIHIATRPVGESHARLWLLKQAAAWVLALGALTPLGLIAMVQGRQAWAGTGNTVYGLVCVAFAALVLSVASGAVSDAWSDKLFWAFSILNGALVCLALIAGALALARRQPWRLEAARASASATYLLLWVLGTTGFYVIFAPFVASRHVLLILPPVTLLIVGRCGSSLTRVPKVFGLALTVVVSAGLCLSDWRFAEFYKVEAVLLARSLPGTGTLWTSGHWGWQWYATRSGFREVDVRLSELRPGDHLVVAEEVNHRPLEAPPPLRLVRTDAQSDPLFNLFCTGRNSRFYSSSHKVAPWSLSRNCINHLSVFQVEAGEQPPSQP